MPTEDELMFGKIVLLQKYCDKEKLSEAFNIQKESDHPRPIEEILFAKGYLTEEQIKEVRKIQEDYLSASDAGRKPKPGGVAFGAMAATIDNLDKADIAEALAEQEERRAGGSNPRLGEILHSKGKLETANIEEILNKQAKRLLKCTSCNSQFNVANYNPDKEYVCSKCNGILKVPEEISNVHAEETLDSGQGATLDWENVPAGQEDDKFLGKEIGGCMLYEKVGEGGMGAVYKAKHLSLDKVVAVKIMLLSMTTEEQKKRFIREARSAAKLDHPNIVGVLNVGEEEGYHYIVMQFITGTSVGDILKSAGAIELERATKIVRDTALALKDAHSQNIIHRDIKPDNIIVTGDGQTKVVDFGLARDVESVGEVTRTGQILGTPFFMAPEQFSGANVDNRADIYALGVTFYYMISGQKPFVGNTPFEVMMAHMNNPITPLKETMPGIPDEIDQVIANMTAKAPEDRYESMEQVITDLEAILARYSSATMVSPSGVMSTQIMSTSRKKKKSMTPIIGIAAGILVVIAAVIAVVMSSSGDNGNTGAVTNGSGGNEQVAKIFKGQLTKIKRYIRDNNFDSAKTELDDLIKRCNIQSIKDEAVALDDSLPETVINRYKELNIEQLEKEKKYTEALEKVRPFKEQIILLLDKRTHAAATAKYQELSKKITGSKSETPAQKFDKAKRLLEKKQYELARTMFAELTACGDRNIETEAEKLLAEAQAELTRISEEKTRKEYDRIKAGALRLAGEGEFDQALDKLAPYLTSKIEDIRKDAQTERAKIQAMQADYEKKRAAEQARKKLAEIKLNVDAGEYETARKKLIKLRSVEAVKTEVNNMLARVEAFISFEKGRSQAAKDLEAGRISQVKRFYESLAKSPYPEIKAESEKGLKKVDQALKKAFEGMVKVEAGEAVIGSDFGPPDALKQKKKTFKAFYIDRYEVTNAEYRKFVDATSYKAPSHWSGGRIPPGKENHPVVNVSLADARAYARWAGKRLPSEEEWEYAARGKKSLEFPWGEAEPEGKCHFDASTTVEVGSFPEDKSPFGAYDMTGNVSEWTASRDGGKYVIRGGKYDDAILPQNFFRFLVTSGPRSEVGFRCVKDPIE